MEQADLSTKLRQVLIQMESRCENQQDREILRTAKLFKKISGMPVEVIGFSVEVPDSENQIRVSFTLDYFIKTPAETLADEGLEDWNTARAR